MVLRIAQLGTKRTQALRSIAKRRGKSPSEFVLDLIDKEITRDQRAERAAFEEAAKPLRQGLAKIPAAELDGLVERARNRYARKLGIKRR